jgi:hypothetical protein
MFDSNLSRIKPKLRTQGAVTGNFGRAKSRAGSPLHEIGETQRETIHIAPRGEYVQRMIYVMQNATDAKMREFAYRELHRLNCFQERRITPGRTAEPFRGPEGAS